MEQQMKRVRQSFSASTWLTLKQILTEFDNIFGENEYEVKEYKAQKGSMAPMYIDLDMSEKGFDNWNNWPKPKHWSEGICLITLDNPMRYTKQIVVC